MIAAAVTGPTPGSSSSSVSPAELMLISVVPPDVVPVPEDPVSPLVVDPGFETLLENVYGDRMTDGHRRMALVPEGAELVCHDDVRWPTVLMRNVWVLPGVPEAFRMKLAVVRAHIQGRSTFVSREVRTKMDEPDLKPLLDRVVASHPDVEVGSYPKWFDPLYKTKITFDATDRSKLDAAVADFLALLPPGEPQNVG